MKSVCSLTAVALMTIAAPALAETDLIEKNGDFSLLKFHDPFENKVVGFSTSNSRIRFDQYDTESDLFVLIQKDVDYLSSIPDLVLPFHTDRTNLVIEPSSRVATRLLIKVDDEDIFSVCDTLSRSDEGCDTHAGLPTCLVSEKARSHEYMQDCQETFSTRDISFFLPPEKAIELTSGSQMRIRLEVFLRSGPDQRSDKKTHYDFPVQFIDGASKTIEHMVDLAQDQL